MLGKLQYGREGHNSARPIMFKACAGKEVVYLP